jgi:hypothetical protein
MKLYIGCNGEYGEGKSPNRVGFSKAAVARKMTAADGHFGPWEKQEDGSYVSGCDVITIREVDIPDSIILSLIAKDHRVKTKVFDVD